MTTKTAFDALFNQATAIDYQQEWNNGTGYFDGAAGGAHAPTLQQGELRRFNTGPINNRNVLLIGMGQQGNFVIFERFTNGEADVYAVNYPRQLYQSVLAAFGDGTSGAMTPTRIQALYDLAVGQPA